MEYSLSAQAACSSGAVLSPCLLLPLAEPRPAAATRCALTTQCGSLTEACVNSPIAGAHDWPLSPSCRCVSQWSWPMPAKGFISSLASQEGAEGQFPCLPSQPAKDWFLAPCCLSACEQPEQSRSPDRSSPCWSHGKESQVAGSPWRPTSSFYWPYLTSSCLPSPRDRPIPSPGLSIRLISLIWQILITLIRAFLNRHD